MGTLRPDQFQDFFEALHGWKPFPWQERLARQVTSGTWPAVIMLPTASGKTASIDIAIFALALQADLHPEDRTAPRRIFFVVDRRLIVDEAFARARRIAAKLNGATGGVLREVANRLRRIAGDDAPLACFQLRGGIYRDDAWARTPLQPTVLAATVDQIGSRLLFRGYGLRSGYVAPIHAGLVAYDSLVILDEAHCAKPFMQSLQSVRRYATWARSPIGRPLQAVLMTATPPAETSPADFLQAGPDDWAHPLLGRRLRAQKPTCLVVAKKAKGPHWQEALADELVSQASSCARTGAKAVAVIVNRVATARLVHARLQRVTGADAVLMIGRMRPIDRDQLIGQWLPKLATGAPDEDRPIRPVFTVATQCLEVGADLDFDALVSECASLDSVRQRFGRLNRGGRPIGARGVIIIRADQLPKADNAFPDDPIYGEALARTWQWLSGHARSDTVDLGIKGLSGPLATLRPEQIGGLETPSVFAPVMLPTHIDFLAQTSPQPMPDPDISLFLHGPSRGVPEVHVAWRADLDSGSEDEEAWIEAVSLCPPTSGECMAVPLNLVREWLRESGRAVRDEGGDSSDVTPEESPVKRPKDQGSSGTIRVLRWSGPEGSEFLTNPDDLHPGDTLVIPTSLAGWESFGYIPSADDTPDQVDIGDQTFLSARDRAVLRVHPNLIGRLPPGESRSRLHEAASTGEVPEDQAAIRELLADLATSMDSPPWLRRALLALAGDRRMRVLPHPFGGLVLQGSRRVGSGDTTEIFTDEDDSSSATARIPLKAHLEGVALKTTLYAQACGLGEALVASLALAARCHDLGKADPRFQVMLHAGNRWAAAASELLAKSDLFPNSAKAYARMREVSGWPRGGRHELLSVNLMKSAPEMLSSAQDPDLVLHLIASHHGRCRALAPCIEDLAPEPAAIAVDGSQMQTNGWAGIERIDSGVAERFWSLTRKYGWWGLAYLEAILRLADHRRSEEEQETLEA